MSFGVIYVVLGAVFGIIVILVIPFGIIKHNRRSELAANMKANNARLFHEQEEQRRRNVGDLEYGLSTRIEPSSNHGGITSVTQLGGSRAVHVPPQVPPPAYVRHSRDTTPARRSSQSSHASPSRTGGANLHLSTAGSTSVSAPQSPLDPARNGEDIPPAYSAVVSHR